MAWVPAMIGGVSSILGGERRNRMETKLANTAHQREVADLRAAGLNPILSATGGSGATTPSLGNVMEGAGDTVNSAFAAQRQKFDIRNLKATEEILRQQGRKAKVDADVSEMFSSAQAVTALEGAQIQNELNSRLVPRAEIEKQFWERAGNLADKAFSGLDTLLDKLRGMQGTEGTARSVKERIENFVERAEGAPSRFRRQFMPEYRKGFSRGGKR